jgi:peptidoglycan/LPS O-acetylase OafA/YrhL
MSEAPEAGSERVAQLDGWRAVSIGLVLAAHLLPLGPSRFHLNVAAGRMGMALFFTLSGYLITTFLLARPDARVFLIRRLFRILPLAWAVLLLLIPVSPLPISKMLPSFLFYQNYDSSASTAYNSHFWSLCVEMHFYVAVAILVAIGGRRSLWMLPLGLVVLTVYRFAAGVNPTIQTHLRIDEIFAGATLALWFRTPLRHNGLPMLLRFATPWVGLLFLLATCLPQARPLTYLRPYAGALLVGSTLLQPEHWMSRKLASPVLKYVATVSYAVYVFHGPLRAGWFDEGTTALRYLVKRPLTLILTFGFAHLSTFYWESWWIGLARRLTKRSERLPVGSSDGG